jgi:hypothetical protein
MGVGWGMSSLMTPRSMRMWISMVIMCSMHGCVLRHTVHACLLGFRKRRVLDLTYVLQGDDHVVPP